MNLTIIDVSGWIYRHYWSLPAITRTDGVQVGAVHGCATSLWRLMKNNPTNICVVFDAAKHTHRHDIYPEYKGHRQPPPPGLPEQFPLIRKAIDAFGVCRHEMVNYEADDVIATLAERALAQGLDVTIISSDKDLMQLVSEHDEIPAIRLFDPISHKMLGPQDVMSKHGVMPSKMIDYQALVGDAADNVPGVPGIGAKTAAKLITEYGDLDSVIAAAKLLDANMGKKVVTNLNLFAKEALMSRELVTLRTDVPIEFDLNAMRCRAPDPTTVAAFLAEMELKTLHDEIFKRAA